MFIDQFPFSNVVQKIAISLGIGLLTGLEREWSNKDLGARTFALSALLGTAATLFGSSMVLACFTGILLIAVLVNVRSLLQDRSLETTTSVALFVTYLLGALAGQGHLFTPVAAAILMVMLLAWKFELQRFAGGLQPEEIRSAVLLCLLGLVVYPILPDRFIDRWQLLNPRESWTIVVVLAGIGFVNYALLKIFRTRGLYYGALLGGLVNSTGTNAELSTRFHDASPAMVPVAISLLLLTNLAMFARNITTLFIFARPALVWVLAPIAAMAVTSVFFIWGNYHKGTGEAEQLTLPSPVSLGRVLKFAAIFVVLSALGTLAQRIFGNLGFLVVSVLGGLVSSASTTATAAILTTAGKISPEMAGIGTVLASMASSVVDLPLVYQQSRQKALTRRFALATALIIIVGVVALLAVFMFEHRLTS